MEGCPSITLDASNFKANGHLIFSDVPSNISVAPTIPNMGTGCFVGFTSNDSNSRHVVSMGKLDGIKFMSIFRFKLWWSTLWVGNKGSDVELETQMMMLESSESGRPYVLVLPLIDGSFTASLQAGDSNNVDVCVESGSTQVISSTFTRVVYMHVGNDPYILIKDAMKVVKEHLGTFKLLEEKTPAGIIDKFGWCTWDAFYREVHPQGVWEGVKGLVEGGCPPGFIIIDDGWQTTSQVDNQDADEQMPRLIDFEENHKFNKYSSKIKKQVNGLTKGVRDYKGMGALVKDLKESFRSIEYVYVWHALCGYRGGVRPDVLGMPESTAIMPNVSPGLMMGMEDTAFDLILNHGVGMVIPEMAHQLYEGLHSHLENAGIDGVKIDYIQVLELLCEEYGGRVELAKTYFNALSASVKKHFKGNGVISSMEQCNDFLLLGTETISLGRVGDDFWTTETQADPNGEFWLQGCHMVHCAYNSLWIGNFIHPDWDMFQSTHPCAEFHAASRAISGGPVYISDNVGRHNFKLLRRLVLPDGSVLRCERFALPTRDCLFEDPLHDGKTMLKIWNLNKYTGVIGAFNCQGGGWSRKARKNINCPEFCHDVSSTVNPKQIEWEKGSVNGVESFAVYAFKANKLVVLKTSGGFELSLQPFTFELLTVSPVRMFRGVHFAPIGLVNMLNTGGAIQSLSFDDQQGLVQIAVKGAGDMRVYASVRAKVCRIDGEEASFVYHDEMVVIHVPWQHSSKLSLLEYYF